MYIPRDTFKERWIFDPGAGTTNLVSVGAPDIFVQKMDSTGNFLWAKSFGDTSTDIGASITVDASGNVYTTGRFQGTVDFDPGAGTTNLVSAGSYDTFVQKMDSTGNFLWAKSFGGTVNDIGASITVDTSGNVYTAGHFQGTVDFDPGAGTTNLVSAGNYDIFVQKMDSSGNFLWAKSFGASSSDATASITVDTSDNVYTAGHFQGTVDFDPGAGTTNLVSAGATDIFVQKMDSWGNLIWAKSFGDTSYDRSGSIAVDASDNVYTTGHFQGTVDFNPGAGTTNLVSAGGYDIFVQKMSQATLGIEENSFGNDLKIYPNPTKGHFYIDLGSIYGSTNILITDVTGKLIFSQSTAAQAQIVDLSINEPKGIYFVTVFSGDRKAVIKMIKE